MYMTDEKHLDNLHLMEILAQDILDYHKEKKINLFEWPAAREFIMEYLYKPKWEDEEDH